MFHIPIKSNWLIYLSIRSIPNILSHLGRICHSITFIEYLLSKLNEYSHLFAISQQPESWHYNTNNSNTCISSKVCNDHTGLCEWKNVHSECKIRQLFTYYQSYWYTFSLLTVQVQGPRNRNTDWLTHVVYL